MGKQKTIIDLAKLSPETRKAIDEAIAREQKQKDRAYNIYGKEFSSDAVKSKLSEVYTKYSQTKDADGKCIASRVVQAIAKGMTEQLDDVLDLADSYANSILAEVQNKNQKA